MKYPHLIHFLLALLAVGCSPAAGARQSAQLTPYFQPSAAATLAVTAQVSPTALPTPTPEPRFHTVQAGETISSISLFYGVEIAVILAANPEVNPNAMSVGIQLIIPPASAAPAASNLLPTPVAIPIADADCYLQADGGAWCFALVSNDQEYAIENVTVQILLAGLDGVGIRAQEAVAPLNIIPSGSSLALATRFSAPVPDPFRSGVQLLTALPVPTQDVRYLQTALVNPNVQISGDGMSAELNGEVLLPVSDDAQLIVRMAAVAYSTDGRVVGLRRWQSVNPTIAEQKVRYTFRVYSAGGQIARVEVFAEAQLTSS